MDPQGFSPARKTPRFAPRRPVTVAMSHDGVPTGYGIIANLSEGGACVQTKTVPPHRDVEMMLSFYEGLYFQVSGRVVWSRPEEGIATVGVEFTRMSAAARQRLKDSLVKCAFEPV